MPAHFCIKIIQRCMPTGGKTLLLKLLMFFFPPTFISLFLQQKTYCTFRLLSREHSPPHSSAKENKSCAKQHLSINQRIKAFVTFAGPCQGSNSSPFPDAYSHTAAKSPLSVITYVHAHKLKYSFLLQITSLKAEDYVAVLHLSNKI